MKSLVLAVCVALGRAPPPLLIPGLPAPIRVPMRIEIPLRAPAGWKTVEQDRATILTPGDVPEGKFYRVMITLDEAKAGTLDEILAAGKKMVADIGTFERKAGPSRSSSEGGWDYQLVIGTITLKDRALLATLVAIRKGDRGGMIVVLADGAETMAAYADAFATMIREMGGAKAAPTDPARPGATRLEYRAPATWVESKIEGLPYFVKERNEDWLKYRLSLLVLPGEPLTGTLREQFDRMWRAYVTPNYAASIAPLPLMTRLRSGGACAFDAQSQAKDGRGAEVTVALYMLAHGGRAVPVVGVYAGPDWTSDNAAESEIREFLDTARILGATDERVGLFSAEALVGEWSESSSEFANYVTRSGDYAGDATISASTYLDLRADRSYERTLIALSGKSRIREKDAGTWTVEDDELVLTKAGRYSLLGYGADPKLGRFLVLGPYPNQKSRLKLTNPRGILQSMWMKAKRG